ncbi:hypothetical protein V5799_014632 [Amblyomma americanum]|uniref:Uncharacterized protein n=1 Tax=Amblyomma americanum TaxID=6943 RepID=A0AAQ4E2G5_AMBAM
MTASPSCRASSRVQTRSVMESAVHLPLLKPVSCSGRKLVTLKIQCLRNGLLASDYLLPEGRVSLKSVRRAIALDGKNVALQALYGITSSHTNPNSVEVQRVSLAFQLFSDKVVKGLQLHRAEIEETCGNISSTLHFFDYKRDAATRINTGISPNSRLAGSWSHLEISWLQNTSCWLFYREVQACLRQQ